MPDITPPTGLSWLFLDLNSYFASVEQQENPALRGKPIAVLPMMTDATCAIAASYEAKKFGIRTGTKIYDAKKMCPGLICVPARHDLYVKYHHRILEETVRHVPINKVWSIDELSSRLPPRLREAEAAMDAARRLKAGIRTNVGTQIQCSVGIASNSFLAKVATNMQKPDGLVVLEPESMTSRLFALDLQDLPGINKNMKARLHHAGVRSIEQLWHLPPKQARAIWGGVGGERFWYNLRGHDIPDTPTHTSSVGHSRILDLDLRTPDMARQVTRRLVVKAAARLRRKELFAGHFYFGMRTTVPDDPGWSAEIRLDPTDDTFVFLGALDRCWAGMLAEKRPRQLKKVSIMLLDIKERGTVTGDLFAHAAAQAGGKPPRTATLSRLIDRINEKHGGEAITLGIPPRTKAGYVGTKIAFSRIPDVEEFHE